MRSCAQTDTHSNKKVMRDRQRDREREVDAEKERARDLVQLQRFALGGSGLGAGGSAGSRGAGGGKEGRNQIMSRSPSFHHLEGGPAYTPHVSVGYLDIARTDVMNQHVCAKLAREHKGLEEVVRVTAISAWSTEGKVGQWKR